MKRLCFVITLMFMLGATAHACGDVVTVATHGQTTTRYALVQPPSGAAPGARVALVLLPGGSGHINLNEQGCPRALVGNSLIRSLPHFHALNLATALVDAPSDHFGDDGLGGFRIDAQHAEDLGKIIADVRTRTGAPVWIVGTSRGAISAANAASRLTGPSAPDGVVLTSPVSSPGQRGWVTQTVFNLALDAIRIPLLGVGHAADACVRSPPGMVENIVARSGSARRQAVVVTGGPQAAGGASNLAACEGRTPHGFIGQEAEVAAGIARFVRGGSY